MTLARDDFNAVVHIRNCEDEERSWHFMHLGAETTLVGNWYRPGATFHDGFSNLQADFVEFSIQVSGIILTGDLNIHHQRWLIHSNGNTAVGSDMKVLCDSYGLTQMVREPTREQYLLHLFISDLPECKVSVSSSIADHKIVLADVPMPLVEEKTVQRFSWKLNEANWRDLNAELKKIDWSILRRGTAEEALSYFLDGSEPLPS